MSESSENNFPGKQAKQTLVVEVSQLSYLGFEWSCLAFRQLLFFSVSFSVVG